MKLKEIISALDGLSLDEQEKLSRHLRARLHLTPEKVAEMFEKIDSSTPEDYISLAKARELLVSGGAS